jgi:hypothetical protein
LEISDAAHQKIKNKTKLSSMSYKFIIESHSIRHVLKGHEDDFHLLIHIPDILNNFSSVEKSLTRNKQTGQTDVSLEFRKKIDDDIIKTVSIRLLREKIFSFKTFFRI